MTFPTQFFRTEFERNLWIKTKAEFIQHIQRVVNFRNLELGTIDATYSPMWIAHNQLVFDEGRGKLRISLDQLLTFSFDEYKEHSEKIEREKVEALITQQ